MEETNSYSLRKRELSNMQKTEKRTQWILTALIFAGCLFLFRSYLFGNELFVFADAGSDTKEQYLMQYNTIVNHIRAGDFSFWDFHYGLGTNLFMLNLADPFLMLLYGAGVLFGPEYLPFYLIYYHIVKILLAGLMCYHFLSCFVLSERVKGLMALIYAFSGYLMVWGQHYQFSTAVIFYPLILCLAEKTLRDWKKGIWLALACWISVCSSLYLSYMTLLAAGIYVVFRVFWIEESFGSGLRLLLRTGAFMLLGTGMACAVLLPEAAVIFGVTDRVDSGQPFLSRIASMLSGYEPGYYKTLFGRLLSSNFEGSATAYFGNNNYYEAPSVFLTALAVFLGFQYGAGVPGQNCGRKKKILQVLAVLLGAFLLLCKLGSAAFNGFAYSFSRHTFVLIPACLLMMSFTLERIFRERKLSLPALGAAFVLVAGGYLWGMSQPFSGEERKNLLILFILAAGMGGALLWCAKSSCKKGPALLLCFAVFASLLSDGAVVNQNRNTLKKDADSYFDQLYRDSIQEAQAFLMERDPEFFRTEKLFNIGSLCMDSLAQEYSGISSYNSMINGNILEFAENLWPSWLFADKNHFYMQNVKGDTTRMALLGVKYLLAREGDLVIPGYKKLQDFTNLSVYENQKASVGKFFTASMTQKAFEENRDTLDRNRVVTQCVLLEEEGRFDRTEELLTGCAREESFQAVKKKNRKIRGKTELKIPVNAKALEGYEQVTASFDLKADRDGTYHVRAGEELICESTLKKGKQVEIEITLPKGTEQITVDFGGQQVTASVKNLEVYGNRSLPSFGEEGEVRVKRHKKDNLLTGEVKAETDGIVLLAVPCEQGWSLEVDGVPAEIFRADYGLTGFEVSEGEHTFALVFTPPLLRAGIGISLVSLAGYAGLCIAVGKKRREEVGRKQG